MWSLILYKIIVSFHFHVLFLVVNHYVTGIARDRRGRDRMVVGFTTTRPMQSVPITTDVVSLNTAQGEVYNIM